MFEDLVALLISLLSRKDDTEIDIIKIPRKVSVDVQEFITVEAIDETHTANIASMSTVNKDIKPPAGYIYELIDVLLHAPAPGGAASGKHMFSVQIRNDVLLTTPIMVISLGSVFGSIVSYRYGWMEHADDHQYPPDDVAQSTRLRGIVLDADTYVKISYSNLTDVTQSSYVHMELLVKQVKVSV